MLVGMDSKASHAKGMPGVTLTIAPCLCAAFRARMGDVQCVPLVECCVYTFQLPSPFCRFTMTCSDNVRARVRTGDAAATPLSFSLFVSSALPVFCKIPMSALPFLLCTRPSLHCIHLCDRQKESELPIGPPFRCPNIFQTWIVTMIVDVINPVLGTVVSAEGLGVFEGSPHTIHEPPRRIVLNLVQDPMRRHDLRDVVTIFGAMHQELLSFHLLNKCLRVAQRLCHHVP